MMHNNFLLIDVFLKNLINMDCACCYVSLIMSNMCPGEKVFLVKGIC